MRNPYTEDFEGHPPLTRRSSFFVPIGIEEVHSSRLQLALYRSAAIEWMQRLFPIVGLPQIHFSYRDDKSLDGLIVILRWTDNSFPVGMRKLKRSGVSHWPRGDEKYIQDDGPFTQVTSLKREEHESDRVVARACHLLMDYIEVRGLAGEVADCIRESITDVPDTILSLPENLPH